MEPRVSRISEGRLRLPEPVMRALLMVARSTGLTASQVVESLLFEFLQDTTANGVPPPLSAVPLAKSRRGSMGTVLDITPRLPREAVFDTGDEVSEDAGQPARVVAGPD